jgi:cytochrome c-type biogenesis protein CcmF
MFILLTWLLLALSGVIVLGTLWPVVTRALGQSPQGLGPPFYNQVCLPLFSLVFVLLPLCVWTGWKSWGIEKSRLAGLVCGLLVLGILVWLLGLHKPLSLVAISLAGLSLVSLVLVIFKSPGIRKSRKRWSAYGIHLGMAVIAIGVAVSGPYKTISEAVLKQGNSLTLDGYTVTYQDFIKKNTKSLVAYQAVLEVTQDGQQVGMLRPERRLYRNFEQPFAEASVLPSLGDEMYATLLGFSQDEVIRVQIRVNPLVNWLWIGGVLVCVFGLLTLSWRCSAKEWS